MECLRSANRRILRWTRRKLSIGNAIHRSPFARWFEELNAVAAARVTIALTRLSQGNFANIEGVGAAVYEIKLDFGPAYRLR